MGEAALVAARCLGAGVGCSQDLLDAPLAAIEVEDLLHRHAGVVADREELLSRRVDVFVARQTGEVPGDVFDVGRVDLLVALELGDAIGEPVSVVEGQSPLPQLRLDLRAELDERIEGLGRLLRLAGEEEIDAVVEERVGIGGLGAGASRGE